MKLTEPLWFVHAPLSLPHAVVLARVPSPSRGVRKTCCIRDSDHPSPLKACSRLALLLWCCVCAVAVSSGHVIVCDNASFRRHSG